MHTIHGKDCTLHNAERISDMIGITLEEFHDLLVNDAGKDRRFKGSV